MNNDALAVISEIRVAHSVTVRLHGRVVCAQCEPDAPAPCPPLRWAHYMLGLPPPTPPAPSRFGRLTSS
jgi:hypothetical protein